MEVGVGVAVGTGVAVGSRVAVGSGVGVAVGSAAIVCSILACTVASISGVEVGTAALVCSIPARIVASISGVEVGVKVAVAAAPQATAPKIKDEIKTVLSKFLIEASDFRIKIISLDKATLLALHTFWIYSVHPARPVGLRLGAETRWGTEIFVP
ncbi:MAG: hypothetical protein O7E55_10555 [Chloroflexi bacterium]|nr:hypothetical protein [Chloroflexota bacterium]